MNKFIRIIGFDILITLVPFLSGLAPLLVDWVSYFLVALSLITAIILITSDNNSTYIKTLKVARNIKPKWWNYYDIISDLVFIAIWVAYGYYIVVFMLVIVKLLIITQIPGYYKK